MTENQPLRSAEPNGVATPLSFAVIGAGVIGSGWLARFVLNGHNVRLFDPGPRSFEVCQRVLNQARAAFIDLYGRAAPKEGKVQFCSSVEEAVVDADYIQESCPERLETKQSILRTIANNAPSTALIASSTSGLLPSDLQEEMRSPDRFLVAHPFNPVYLLPLVELVAGHQTGSDTLTRASTILKRLGMKPLLVRKEIDAFIADRLMEALWREALWLIHDDVATAEEIDDAIRYGCGLRWAQMGTFQTYMIAGGEAGMRHFLAQFGPALEWPWTKLTDTPDLDQVMVDKIAEQTESQARGRSSAELEQIRDENLVAILRALGDSNQGKGWGAGRLVREHRDGLANQSDEQA